jgi:hypothetical protein
MGVVAVPPTGLSSFSARAVGNVAILLFCPKRLVRPRRLPHAVVEAVLREIRDA